MTVSPNYRDFTFKVKAKITPRLSQMKANERAGQLGKGSNSIFIKCSSSLISVNSSWLFDSIIPRSPAENSVGRTVGFKAMQPSSLPGWTTWCRMSVGKGLHPTEAQCPQMRKRGHAQYLAHWTFVRMNWAEVHVSNHSVVPHCSLGAHTLPTWNSIRPQGTVQNTTSQVNCSLTHLWHLTSSVTYTSHVACHLFCPWVLCDSLRHQHFLFLTQSDGNIGPF